MASFDQARHMRNAVLGEDAEVDEQDDYEGEGQDYLEPEPCSVCSGPLIHLGTLGRLDWFRCRNCGWQESRTA